MLEGVQTPVAIYRCRQRMGSLAAPDHRPVKIILQLITLPSSALAAAPWSGAQFMIEASVSSGGASPVDSHFEPIQKPSTQCRSARNSARRYRSSQSRSATARSPRWSSTGSIKESATASRSAPRFAVAGIRGNGRNSSRIRGSNASTSDPVAARTYLGGPKLATAAFTVFCEQPTTRGCLPSTRVTASALGDALGMVGRPVSTGLHVSCRLSSLRPDGQREGE